MEFILKVSNQGKILEVVKGEEGWITPEDNFLLHNGMQESGFTTFFQEIRDNGFGNCRPFKFDPPGCGFQLFVAGIKWHEDIYLFGAEDKFVCEKIFNQVAQLKKRDKENIKKIFGPKANIEYNASDRDFEELTKINNELINLQRELAKKHILLEHTNTEQEKLLGQLDQKNQELKEKNKEVELFAYMVSHDLKSPLARILSLVELLEINHIKNLDEEGATLVQYIKDAGNKMDQLIRSVLSYTRVTNTEVEISTFSLKAFFEEIKKETEKPEGLQIVYPPEDCEITGSYMQLYQVISNLVSNAIKYHHSDHGKIEISFQDNNDFIQIAVKDDGPGIPEQFQEKIFDLFESANSRERKDSTGIGLAIVKKLVAQNGGTIDLSSQEGKGSTFRFFWPKKIEK